MQVKAVALSGRRRQMKCGFIVVQRQVAPATAEKRTMGAVQLRAVFTLRLVIVLLAAFSIAVRERNLHAIARWCLQPLHCRCER